MQTASCRFPGGLKQRTAQEQFAKDPSSILREAVLGMLPKNNLRKVSAQAPAAFLLSASSMSVAVKELLSLLYCFLASAGKSRVGSQGRDRKLRIFPSSDHPFQDHPRLIGWEPGPRRLRIKEPLFELPEGWEPMNPEASRRRPIAVWMMRAGSHSVQMLSPSITRSATDHHVCCAGLHEALRA